MNLYFTTVARGAPIADAGQVVCLDWDTKTVVASASIGPLDVSPPPNPRGGSRGGRGVAIQDGNVLALGSDVLYSLPLDLSEQTVAFSHPRMEAHEILVTPTGGVFIAATRLNAIVTTTDGVITPLTNPRMVTALEAVGMTGPHLHLNAVALWNDDLLALCNHLGAIINITTGTVVMHNELLVRAHDLVVVGDQAYVVSTGHKELLLVDLTAGTVIQSWPLGDPKFARGLALVTTDGTVTSAFVGCAPGATVMGLTLATGAIESFVYQPDVRMAVHGICIAS